MRIWPNTAAWKAFIVTVVTALSVLDLYAATMALNRLRSGYTGDSGFSVSSRADDDYYLISEITPKGPMAAAGARVGDYVRFASPGDVRRIQTTGETLQLRLKHDRAERQLSLVVTARTTMPLAAKLVEIEIVVYALLGLGLATLIGLKRPESASARFLALTLLAPSTDLLLRSLPSGVMQNVVYTFIKPLGFCVNYVGIVYFSMLFPHDAPNRVPTWMRWSALAFLVLFLVHTLATTLDRLNFPVWSAANNALAGKGLAICSSLLAVVGLLLSYRRADGDMRQRVRWVGLSIGAVYLVYVTSNTGMGEYFDPNAFTALQGAIVLLSMIGLSYACLRLRVFDFGFVVNRTLVFSFTSVMLILVFFLTERLAHQYLHFESAEKNALLSGSIAFGLFFAFNRLHHKVDHMVERFLFRNWHANSAALNHFVRKASHFTSSDRLLHALGTELDRFTSGAGHAIYRADRDSSDRQFVRVLGTLANTPNFIDDNDDIAVTLRETGIYTNLRDVAWEFAGELLLPMMRGSSLYGIVIVGPKPNGGAYRPDEIEALSFAVTHIGLDLFALRVQQLEAELLDMKQRAAANERLVCKYRATM